MSFRSLAAAVLAAALATGVAAPVLLAAPAGAAVPVCGNADLTASYHPTDAATSHRYGRLVLTNTSGATCTVRGYGGLSYVGDGDGTQIGAAADRMPGRVRTVVLHPGQKAVSRVSATTTAPYPRRRCRPAAVDGFRVYVPDATVAQFVPHRTRGCRNARIHLLAHTPYRKVRGS